MTRRSIPGGRWRSGPVRRPRLHNRPWVPTWEELNGPLPEGDSKAVQAGLTRARLREKMAGCGDACPRGHEVEKG